MKTYLNLLFLCLVFAGCSSSPDEPKPNPKPEKVVFSMEESEFTVPSKGKVLTLKVTSNVSYHLTSDSPWCSVVPDEQEAGSHTIVIVVEENSTNDDRTAQIAVKGEGLDKSIEITQRQKNAIVLSNLISELPAEGGSCTFELQSNVEVTVAVDEGAAGWVTSVATRGMTGHSYSFSVAENKSVEQREASIEFKSGDLVEHGAIRQKGAAPYITADSKDFELNDGAQEVLVAVQSNVEYSVILPGVEWLHQNMEKSVGGHLCFNLDANEGTALRKASVTLVDKKSGASLAINFSQKGMEQVLPYITADLKDFELNDGAQEVLVAVQSNVEYSVILPGVEWLHQNMEKSVDGHLCFNLDANEGTALRKAAVTLVDKKSGTSLTIHFSQKGMERVVPYITVDSKDFELNDGAQEVLVAVQSNVEYSVILPGVEWLHQNMEKSVDGHLCFNLDANEGTALRKASVTLVDKQSGTSLTIHFSQKGMVKPFLNIQSDGEVTVAAKGDKLNVKFATNNPWTLATEAAWITITNERGDAGEVTVEVEVSENTTSEERVGTLTIQAGEIIGTIKIRQPKKQQASNKIDDFPVETWN